MNGDWKAGEVTAVVFGASEKENGGEYKSDRLHIGCEMSKALSHRWICWREHRVAM